MSPLMSFSTLGLDRLLREENGSPTGKALDVAAMRREQRKDLADQAHFAADPREHWVRQRDLHGHWPRRPGGGVALVGRSLLLRSAAGAGAPTPAPVATSYGRQR